MRTTLILPDELYRQVKERASEDDETMTSFVEAALRRELSRRLTPARPRDAVRMAPATGRGGVQPGVDLTSNAALLDIMEEGLPVEKRH